ncbi:MAG: hypothetical protein LBQ54_00155 [Planctomycetaceae bacterium]|jgi:hypothetical protein|nr:hypothetical protein [Planctomycetaceae bacterium]
MRAVNPDKKKVSILGLGLDNRDGQTRITRGKNFLLYGGSEQTHGIMQEAAIKVNEKLDRKGKCLEEISPEEIRDIFSEVSDSLGRQ